MKHTSILIVLVLSFVLICTTSFAEIPHYMQFQGKATDADDIPLSGTHTLMFRIYDAESAGNLIWTETHTTVDIENGVFSVLLGGVTPLDIAFDIPYWISTEINQAGEMDRQLVSSVGYAYRAKEADRAEVATTADNSGKIVQIVNFQTGAINTGTTNFPEDDTIPQITEGNEWMTLAITPTSATNKLKIDVVVHQSTNGCSHNQVALFQDSTANALAVGFFTDTHYNNQMYCIAFTYYMTAGTTSSTTFKVRGGNGGGGTATFNGIGGSRKFGGVLSSSITITEIAS